MIAAAVIAFSAWFLALAFFNRSIKERLVVSALSMAATAITVTVIEYFSLPISILPVLFLVSLVVALAEAVYKKRAIHEASLLLLFVLITDTIFCKSLHIVCITNSPIWYCLPLLLSLLFWILSRKLSGFFLRQNWSEVFAESNTSETAFKLRSWHLIVIFTTILIVDIGTWLAPADGLVISLILPILMTALFWCGVLLAAILMEHNRISQEMLSEKQYRTEMDTFISVIRSQRHDYNFHVRTLAQMAKNGDFSQCQTYAEELVQDSADMNEMLPIHDPAISATIFNFSIIAAQKRIKLHVDVQNDLSHIATSVYETNKIISNLLQNAIDEVSDHEDKSYGIWLYIHKRGQYCVIRTANKCADIPSVEKMYQRGFTTKQGHSGIGLCSIKAVIAKYGGVVYTSIDNDVIQFVAKVPYRFQSTQEN